MGQQFSREAQSLGFVASDAAPASSLMPRFSHNSGAQASAGPRWWASAPVWRSRFESGGLSQRLGYQGVSVGTDTVISAGGDRLGLSISVVEQSSQSDDFQSKGSYRQASFYGLSPLGAFKASYSLGIGRGSSEQTRSIRLPEQDAVSARANPQSSHLQASVGLSYAFDLAAQVKMEPFVRLSWRKQERSGYTETGAGDLGLQVSEHRGDSHATALGWRWSGKASGWSGRDLHWATHWEWSRHSERYPLVEQRFVNTSAAFTTPGMDADSSATMVAVSLRQVLSKGAEVGLSLGADHFQGRLGRALTLSYRSAW
jgi:outer membrane autotransporter protein